MPRPPALRLGDERSESGDARLSEGPSLRPLRAVAVAAAALSVACAPPRVGEPALAPVPTTGTDGVAAGSRAAPRWVRVASLTGTGAGAQRTQAFDIDGDVVQWRVTATCSSGHVRIGLESEDEPLVDQACPGRFFGFSIRTGRRALDVSATGSWEVVVDQQVETPIDEPALPGMAGSRPLAVGSFTGIEQDGSGAATLHRLADGRLALRLEPFSVTPNDDLFVWASEAQDPRTSADALRSPHVQLEALKATAGSQNYVLPDSLPTDRVRSIVIWCEPVRTAYAAAPLWRR